MYKRTLKIEGQEPGEIVDIKEIENAIATLREPSPTFLQLKNFRGDVLKITLTPQRAYGIDYVDDIIGMSYCSTHSNYSGDEITTIAKLFFTGDYQWKNQVSLKKNEPDDRIDWLGYISKASIVLSIMLVIRIRMLDLDAEHDRFLGMDVWTLLTIISILGVLGSLDGLIKDRRISGRSAILTIIGWVMAIIFSAISIVRLFMYLIDLMY